ncbi:hypothetical protein LCM27_04760 [Ruegeria marisrubri]|uniref:hypothetical protein n=1 Tax=Ruegeria marisrubri TaxID=1685379 RepID=UPI001CD5C901|nr:hypothetical protein [Ruegeria marisrubri]MCA0905702.1 hypothetical protein [Ruegeria marisrubri]
MNLPNLLIFIVMALCALGGRPSTAIADGRCDQQCQLARKAQDPLASIRALVLDNTIGFDSDRDPQSYATLVQPVYSLPSEGRYNVILRGTVPVIGVRDGVVLPPLGPDPRGRSSYSTGLSDSIVQAFFSPKSESDLKFGIGPQVSLRTRTGDELAGPGWGGGVSAVVTGFSGRWSYAAIVGQHWGQQGYSVATINPVLIYNSDLLGGSYIGYSNSLTYNWKASSGNRWQIPLGLTAGKTFPLDNGSAIDLSMGYYKMAERPEGGLESQFKFAVTFILP